MSTAMHMYVWSVEPMFIGVAQARSVEKARELVLECISTSFDGSCPEREKAAIFVRDHNPTIWHGENAEFALTDTAELAEQEHYSRGLLAERDTLAAENASLKSVIEETQRVLTHYPPFDQVQPGKPESLQSQVTYLCNMYRGSVFTITDFDTKCKGLEAENARLRERLEAAMTIVSAVKMLRSPDTRGQLDFAVGLLAIDEALAKYAAKEKGGSEAQEKGKSALWLKAKLGIDLEKEKGGSE